jgi:hypothetical protein
VTAVLENSFYRITLVHHDQTERITLDYGLTFISRQTGNRLEFPGISIAEIKYEHLLANSPFAKALKEYRIPPRRFSKYAIGAALLDGDLKQNRFKQKVRKVHQLNNDFIQNLNSPQHA